MSNQGSRDGLKRFNGGNEIKIIETEVNVKEQPSWFTKRKFSMTDKMLLHTFESTVDAIALILSNNCEVVLCSLESWDNAIVKVVNGNITGRKVGAPLTNLEISILKNPKQKKNVIGPYFVRTETGETIKSVKAIIKNFEDQPIGMCCVNFNLSAPFINIISTMIPTDVSLPQVKPVRYPARPQELIEQSLEIVLSQLKKFKDLSQTERNKRIVLEMLDIGIFEIKGAVDIVAAEMGVTRYTIYNYMREAKVKARKRK